VVLPPAPPSGELKPLEMVSTPGARTIDEVSAMLGTEPRYLVKSLIYIADGKPHMLLIRGDRTLNEIKAKRFLGATTFAQADEATVEKVTGAPVGFAGPIGGESVPVIVDGEVMHMTNFIVGANQADAHYANVGRDFQATKVGDIRNAEEGDLDPAGSGAVLKTTRGIEVGHIFQLGTKYSKAMGVEVSNAEGVLTPVQMGCYGIGVTRTLASIIEVNHDANGIVWPITAAPFEVLIVVASYQDEALKAAGQKLHDELEARGIDVMLDDRDERPGVKFKDADLIGYPIRVVIGKGYANGKLEVKLRQDPNSLREIDAATATDEIARVVAEMKAELSV
jgi:prolyl-tRNA synthetase